jgi:hypothetical protein
MLVARYWVLDVGYWSLVTGSRMLVAEQYRALSIQYPETSIEDHPILARDFGETTLFECNI